MIRLKILSLFIGLSFLLLSAFNGQAAEAFYSIGYFSVQIRVYENGQTINRLAFDVRDNQGNIILNTDGSIVDLDSVKLYDPDNKLVGLAGVIFYPDYEYRGGRFDVVNGCWNYYSSEVLYEFQADILEPLKIGTYRLQLTCDDGVTYEATLNRDQPVTLPYVSSRTFQVNSDSAGNVYFSWTVSEKILQLAKSLNIEYRSYVAAYSGEQLTALLWPNVPVQTSMLFVPQSMIQWLESKGTSFRLGVEIRTSAGADRSRSNAITVSDLLSTVSRKKDVVVVPMF